MQIHVVLASGEDRSVELGATGLVVGSSSDCDIVIADPDVQPRHAFFQIDPVGASTVQEMGTASAVFINGARITGAVALKSTDQVTIGSATLTLEASPTTAPVPATPAVVVPAAVAAATIPPPPPPPGPPSTPAAPPASSSGLNPAVLIGIGVAVLVLVGGIFLVMTKGSKQAAPSPPPPPPSVIPPSPLPTLMPSVVPTDIPTDDPTTINVPPVNKARVDGLYDGKYDFSFKAACASGPCGGFAQSGAQFRIPYSGSSTYRGHSTIRSTCSDGGVHVQAPYQVDLSFYPTDAAMVNGKWMATKVQIDLTTSRKAIVKKVKTSANVITTLTCSAYSKHLNFTAVAA